MTRYEHRRRLAQLRYFIEHLRLSRLLGDRLGIEWAKKHMGYYL